MPTLEKQQSSLPSDHPHARILPLCGNRGTATRASMVSTLSMEVRLRSAPVHYAADRFGGSGVAAEHAGELLAPERMNSV
jgi:hypothetical protein